MEEKETKDESLREQVVELTVQARVSSSFIAFLTVNKGSVYIYIYTHLLQLSTFLC